MEITKNKVLEMLYASIEELNQQLAPEQKLAPSPATALLGQGGGLDSLAFVNLVATVEEKCQERFGATLVLAGNDGGTGAANPFDTVDTLAAYIEQQLNGK